MSPHITLIPGKASAHLSSSSMSGAMWGETVHPRGIVSDVAGSAAT